MSAAGDAFEIAESVRVFADAWPIGSSRRTTCT